MDLRRRFIIVAGGGLLALLPFTGIFADEVKVKSTDGTNGDIATCAIVVNAIPD